MKFLFQLSEPESLLESNFQLNANALVLSSNLFLFERASLGQPNDRDALLMR